jgi:hypothetical protein
MEQRAMAMDRARPESARTQALRDKVALLTENIEETLRGALHLAHLISLADPAIEEDRAAIASAALEVGRMRRHADACGTGFVGGLLGAARAQRLVLGE